MPDKIEPALSAEEWAVKCATPERWMGRDTAVSIVRSSSDVAHLVLHSHDAWREEPYTAGLLATPHNLVPIIALANAALPDSDPRKITREKLANVLGALEVAANATRDESETLAFIAALESYLPPDLPTK